MDLINVEGTKKERHRPKYGRVINFSVMFPRNVRFSTALPPAEYLSNTPHLSVQNSQGRWARKYLLTQKTHAFGHVVGNTRDHALPPRLTYASYDVDKHALPSRSRSASHEAKPIQSP